MNSIIFDLIWMFKMYYLGAVIFGTLLALLSLITLCNTSEFTLQEWICYYLLFALYFILWPASAVVLISRMFILFKRIINYFINRSKSRTMWVYK